MMLVPPQKHKVFKICKEQGLRSSNGVARKRSSKLKNSSNVIFQEMDFVPEMVPKCYHTNSHFYQRPTNETFIEDDVTLIFCNSYKWVYA
jgi:hypothetical protein